MRPTLIVFAFAIGSIIAQAQPVGVPLGTFGSRSYQPYNLHDLIQLRDGRVLVSLAQDFEIRAFAPDGSDLGPFTSTFAFGRPSGLAQLEDGRILVCTREDVVAYSSDGAFLGVYAEDFNVPVAVLELADGRVLVVEEGVEERGRVSALYEDGTRRRRFARDLLDPFDAVQLNDGRVLVLTSGRDGVQAFDPTETSDAAGTPLGPFAPTLDASAATVFDDLHILVYGSHGPPTNRIRGLLSVTAGGTVSLFSGETEWGYGLVRLADGRVLMAERSEGEIEAFSVAPVTAETDAETAGVISASYPNPVRMGEAARLGVTLSTPGAVTVTVHDATGREVTREVHALGADETTVEVATASLAPGVYVVRVSGPGLSTVRRLAVIR